MTQSLFRPSYLKPIHLPYYLQVQNSTVKPYHDFWNGKVSCKIDPEIKLVENFSLLQFFCQWIDLNHLVYQSEYFHETYGWWLHGFLSAIPVHFPFFKENLFVLPVILHIPSTHFYLLRNYNIFHIYCTIKWLWSLVYVLNCANCLKLLIQSHNFFNWNLFHARLNSHYEVWNYKKKKLKKVKACRKYV